MSSGPVPCIPGASITAELLATVRKLLEEHGVTADDNFFRAGGNPLLGDQLAAKLRADFGVSLRLEELLEAPTVGDLASLVEIRLMEMQLSRIWADLLGRERVGRNKNFFDLGGHPTLVSTLQERIAAELDRKVPFSELFFNPTVRQQAELILNASSSEAELPPGVFSLRPEGSRPGIFWIHYLNVNLATAFPADQPLFLLTLTSQELQALGMKTALQEIAACLVRKLLSVQAEGPYRVGGLCIGGLLAYEIARQLHNEGREVAQLILLDAPSPSYLKTYNSPGAKLRRFQFLLGRNMRLGPQQSFANARRRFVKHIVESAGARRAWNQICSAQKLLETAAFAYEPGGVYEGNTLLVLATESSPNEDFLSGWQAISGHALNVKYVPGHHRELMTAHNVQTIAATITSSLAGGARPPYQRA